MRERRCFNCGNILHGNFRCEGEAYYCEECFDDIFCYCDVCDEVMDREYARYDERGLPYCEHCWEEITDYDCPENPEVLEKDRESIIQLSRDWLFGKQIPLFNHSSGGS